MSTAWIETQTRRICTQVATDMHGHTCFLGRQLALQPAQQQRRGCHACKPTAQAVAAPPKFETSTSERVTRS